MSRKQAVMAILVMCTLVSGLSAVAQDEKNEVAGMVGRTIISDQGIQGATFFNPFVRSGKGLTFEGDYARHLLTTPIFRLSGEVPVAFNVDEKLNSGSDVVPKSYKQIFITPALRLNLFPSTAFSLWFSVGGGVAFFKESSELLYYGPNPGNSTTSGVLQGGIGVDVFPFRERFKHFGFRGEARDFWSGTPDLPLADTGKSRQNNYFVGGGVIWRF
jgi:hypothetical protein